MSTYAISPETYSAWRFLELNDELRPYERERGEMDRGKEELALLYSELEKSPTVENMLRFFKRSLELECFTQSSLTRSLERYYSQKICTDDLEARPGAYPCFGTEEEVRQRVEKNRRMHAELAPVIAEIEEGLRRHAENEERLAAVNALIARRRSEQYDESEPSQPQVFSRL
ncbi:hypothetical protein BJV74DRAFT_885794 [Russula compacta]|nr:hypothetical protein BJV74DRAFT_885794 [Russula compacta]